MQFINGAQFLNAISLSLLSINLAATNCASVPSAAGPIFPLISVYASL